MTRTNHDLDLANEHMEKRRRRRDEWARHRDQRAAERRNRIRRQRHWWREWQLAKRLVEEGIVR